MQTNNLFYQLYTKKSTKELQAIATSPDYANDAKLCAIDILKERNEPIESLKTTEQELIEQRDKRIGSEWHNNRYRTGKSRFLALIIDGIILNCITWIFKLLSGFESLSLIYILNVINLVLPYLYHILMHSSYGQTIGKMIMNIKVYDVSETKVISYKQAILRDIIPLSCLVVLQALTYFISTNSISLLVYISVTMSLLLVVWSLLEIVTMLFDEKRRALHDYIAGTVVLKLHS